MSEIKVPQLDILEAFEPVDHGPETALKYPSMDNFVTVHRPYEGIRWDRFINAGQGTIDELHRARHLAQFMMLQTANALNSTQAGTERRELWAERFLLANKEFYGVEYGDETWQDAITSGTREMPRHEYGDYLHNRYSDVLELVEDKEYGPEDMIKLFEAGLSTLAKTDEGDWENWSAELTGTARITVNGMKRAIKVGNNREHADGQQMKALLAHELLGHVVRYERGTANDTMLRKGMPNYGVAEEGIAIMNEAAITGIIPAKIIHRYVDIGLAIGAGGAPMSRAELIELAASRYIMEESSTTETQAQARAAEHINRLFRGTPGDDKNGFAPAVYMKDAIYFHGFHKMTGYINTLLRQGYPMESIHSYIMQGRFDPTDELHAAYVKENGSVPQLP